ncbi:BREX-1 system phosphatase PglZ type A [Nocardia sp. CA-128927]|uniref:BREX-1 system phosphatase PglZ type A n=1 Tax=Nocardia sp. CA-128927 TaxID=3239975 RepID=UPI003D97F962
MSAVAPTRIAELLAERFDDTPVLVWRDTEGEYAAGVDAVAEALAGQFEAVTVHRVSGDEFGVKFGLYAALDADAAGTAKHVVYRAGPREAARDNWLLDLEVGYGVFTADTTAILVHELRLDGRKMEGVLDAHPRVLDSPAAVEAARVTLAELDAKLAPELLAKHLRGILSATALGLRGPGSHRLHRIVEALFADFVADGTTGYDALVEHGLDEFLWTGCTDIYGYADRQPSVAGLAMWLFEQAWRDWPDATNAARFDFERWRADAGLRPVFTALAEHAQSELGIAERVRGDYPSIERLVEVDVFPIVDTILVQALTDAVLGNTVTADRIAALVRKRALTTWFTGAEHAYRAIETAADCLARIDVFTPAMADPADGVRRYSEQWCATDRAYRTFLYHHDRATGDLTAALITRVEHRYTTDFQRPLADAWQQQVDTLKEWRIPGITPLSAFAVQDLPAKAKTLVVISDAFRYEVGLELVDRMADHQWFSASIEPRLAPLPSFTQLGMAASLPHKRLELVDENTVRADGKPTAGLANRAKVWARAGFAATGFESVLRLNKEALGELWSAHAGVVVYHDTIDATGDEPKTDLATPEACLRALEDITRLVNHFNSKVRATRVLVTADHGFLFQSSPVQDAGNLSATAHGDDIVYQNRRFVLGRGLRADPAFTKWRADQLGYDSDLEVLIPRSLYRLKRPGAGSRFVHGGAALPEVVVPLVELRQTKRKKDTSEVEVELATSSQTVTSSTVLVTLTQKEAVTGARRGRTLRVGVWADGKELSTVRTIELDSRTEDIRERVVTVELMLGEEAQQYNGRTVQVRADKMIGGTAVEYKTTTVTLQRGFGGFFDAL